MASYKSMVIDNNDESSDSSDGGETPLYLQKLQSADHNIERLGVIRVDGGHTNTDISADTKRPIARASSRGSRHSLFRISNLLQQETTPVATEIEHEQVTTSILRKSNSEEGLSPRQIEMLSAPNPPLPTRSVPVPTQHLKSPAYYHSRSSLLNPEAAKASSLATNSAARGSISVDAMSLSSESSSINQDTTSAESSSTSKRVSVEAPKHLSPIETSASLEKKSFPKFSESAAPVKRPHSLSQSSTTSNTSIMSCDSALVAYRTNDPKFALSAKGLKRKNSDDVTIRYDPFKRLQRLSVSPTGTRLFFPAASSIAPCVTFAIPPPVMTLPSAALSSDPKRLSSLQYSAPLPLNPKSLQQSDEISGDIASLSSNALAPIEKSKRPSAELKSPVFGQLLNIQGAKDHLSKLNLG